MLTLQLKQQAALLSERERRELSAYLIRLGQQSARWRREMARRLRAMDKGRKISLAELERRLAHG
jgi:hypothetical protein